jgi:HEAT repeat protein
MEAATTIAAARMLARKKPVGAVETLLAFLPRAASPEVDREIRYALRVLAKTNGQPDPTLTKALEDKDPRRRQAAAEALGRAPLPPGSRLLLPDIKYPMKGTVLREGRKFMEWEVQEVIFLNHIDDKEFAMP